MINIIIKKLIKGEMIMFDQYPDVVTIEELCEMLGIGRGLAYQLVSSGKIKGVKVGRGWRIVKKEVDDLL
jgi:excisionase family DNA binding protein